MVFHLTLASYVVLELFSITLFYVLLFHGFIAVRI